MNPFITKYVGDYDAAIDYFKKELANIRTGRANTLMIENVQVEAYGAIQPLNQLAKLGLADSTSMLVEPWDKSVLKDIEKSISKADLGFSVTNTGERLIVKVPLMTEDTRKQMIKLMGEKAEDAKVALRQIREKVRTEILEGEKKGGITQDDRYQYMAELDNTTSDYSKTVENLQKEKAELIITV